MQSTIGQFVFQTGTHRNKDVIWILFPKIQNLIDKFRKKYPSAKWSASQKKWYLPDSHNLRSSFQLPTKTPVVKYAQNHISASNNKQLTLYIEQLKLRAYSVNTQQTYVTEFCHLLGLLKQHPVEKLSAEKLRSYFLYCVTELKVKENHMHSRISAIKFYYEQVLHKRNMFSDIPRPKKPSTLPKVLSISDIQKLLCTAQNSKHKLMLKLCYGMGLRVSEIVNIKITDIDSKRMTVHIQAAKGKKDRYVNLPHEALLDLREYYKEYRPKLYLFEGQYGGQYSIRSVQNVFKQGLVKAQINKSVGIHSLRHSYATHLLEYGTDITYIQKLLGHSNVKTTLTYTHVSQADLGKIKSPLDRLQK